MDKKVLDLPPIFVLYRYFLAANTMHRYFLEQLPDRQYWRALQVHPEIGYAAMFHMGPPGIAMAYFYSAMYVVVEAWRELGYHDSKIDALLESPLVELLRRFRNATFHFQRDFVSDKWAEFINAGGESSAWVLQLRDAFSEFFFRESTWENITGPIPEEIKAQIKGQPIDRVLEIVSEWLRKRSS